MTLWTEWHARVAVPNVASLRRKSLQTNLIYECDTATFVDNQGLAKLRPSQPVTKVHLRPQRLSANGLAPNRHVRPDNPNALQPRPPRDRAAVPTHRAPIPSRRHSNSSSLPPRRNPALAMSGRPPIGAAPAAARTRPQGHRPVVPGRFQALPAWRPCSLPPVVGRYNRRLGQRRRPH